MIHCHLDCWLISNNLHDLTTSADIIPANKTNHLVFSLELNNNDNQIKGPGLWKINSALLEDDIMLMILHKNTILAGWRVQGSFGQ